MPDVPEVYRRATCYQLVRDVLNSTDVEHLVTVDAVEQLTVELTNGLAPYWRGSPDANCAWSDYRRDYGVSAFESVRKREHRAFHAGWDAAMKETK